MSSTSALRRGGNACDGTEGIELGTQGLAWARQGDIHTIQILGDAQALRCPVAGESY